MPGRGVNPSGNSSIERPILARRPSRYGIFDLIGGLRYDSVRARGVRIGHGGQSAVPHAAGRTLYGGSGRRAVRSEVDARRPRHCTWLQPYITYSESMRAPTVSETLDRRHHPSTGGGSRVLPQSVPRSGDPEGLGVRRQYPRRDGVLTRDDSFRLKADYFTRRSTTTSPAASQRWAAIYFCNVDGKSDVQRRGGAGHV